MKGGLFSRYSQYPSNLLSGPGGAIVLFLVDIITILIIAPFFIPAIPKQQNIKDLTFIITNSSAEYSISIKNSGFRTINVISPENIIDSNNFTSIKVKPTNSLASFKNSITTPYVLISGKGFKNIPTNIPSLPQKNMLIGFNIAKCYERGFAAELPENMDGALITKDAFNRFIDFSSSHHFSSDSEAFRVFCDFHSLHLLRFPCNKQVKSFPKWEKIDSIESSSEYPITQLNNIPLIPEVWQIQDLI